MLGQHNRRDWRAESQTRARAHAVDSDPERLMETSSEMSKFRLPPAASHQKTARAGRTEMQGGDPMGGSPAGVRGSTGEGAWGRK